MEKAKIQVEKVENGNWNEVPYADISGSFVDSGDAFKGRAWGKTLPTKFVEGESAFVQYESKTNSAGYTNIKITNVADADGTFPVNTKSSGGRSMKADPAKTASIERQVAAKESVKLIVGGIVEMKDFEGAADTILKFIKGENK